MYWMYRPNVTYDPHCDPYPLIPALGHAGLNGGSTVAQWHRPITDDRPAHLFVAPPGGDVTTHEHP